MQGVIWNIVRVNVIAAVFVVAVTAISRIVGRRYSARWKYWCWIVLAVFLLFPYDFSKHTAVIHMEVPRYSYQKEEAGNRNPFFADKGGKDADPGSRESGIYPNGSSVGKLDGRISLDGGRSEIIQQGIGTDILVIILWLLGGAAISICQLIRYRISYRGLRRWSVPLLSERALGVLEQQKQAMGVRKAIPVLVSDKIKSPMVVGIRKQSLFLPDRSFSREELELLYRHELLHVIRHDIWYKTLLLLVRNFYWFNPALSFMLKEAERDIEYLCDEMVTEDMDKKTRIVYNRLLMTSVQQKNGGAFLFSTNFNGGIKRFKRRVANIMYGKKRKKGWGLVLGCCFLLTGAATLIGCGASRENHGSASSALGVTGAGSSEKNIEIPDASDMENNSQEQADTVPDGEDREVIFGGTGLEDEKESKDEANPVEIEEGQEYYEYQVTEEGDKLRYFNTTYGFSFLIPAEWKDQIVLEHWADSSTDGISFSDKLNAEQGQYGWLFQFQVADTDDIQSEIPGSGRYLYQFNFNGMEKILYTVEATDVQVAPPYSEELTASYRQKANEVRTIWDSVSFQTDKLESENKVENVRKVKGGNFAEIQRSEEIPASFQTEAE